ncbi:MAG: ABC transporter permease [Actinomycetaceae bacterium]|nr:ABC transporter permease [Actinomycetaceae bacterium]
MSSRTLAQAMAPGALKAAGASTPRRMSDTPRRTSNLVPSWVPPVILGLIVLGTWWALTTFGFVNTYFLPRPQDVAVRLVADLGRGHLAAALGLTVREALFGSLIAAAIGIPLGYAIAKSPLFALLVQPYLAASQAIPAVAVAPLMTIWIGYGLAPIVVLCAVMVIFPVIVSTAAGLRFLDAEVVGAARLDGAHGWRLATRIELPLAAPSILAGLRTGFTLSITGAVVGEMVIGGRGLGLTLTSAQHSSDVTGMFATIALLAAVAVSVYALFTFLERRLDVA